MMAGEETPWHIATYYTLHHTRADLAINQGLHFRNRHCLHCLQNAKLRSNAVPNPHVFRRENSKVVLHQDAFGFELPDETLFTLPDPHRKTHTSHEPKEMYEIFGTQHKEQNLR